MSLASQRLRSAKRRSFWVLQCSRCHFRSGSARFELGAHFLNLPGLLPHRGNQSCNFVFQFGNRGFLFLNFVVLFEKLIEHHCVDLLVAHRLGLPLGIASDQFRTDLGYVLCDQAKGLSAKNPREVSTKD
jgi:hypothetical protein